MASGVIKNSTIRYVDEIVDLNSLTWTLSLGGMYYTKEVDGIILPADAHYVLGIILKDWGNLRATDNIIPYIYHNSFCIMANTNTFKTDALLTYRLAYI